MELSTHGRTSLVGSASEFSTAPQDLVGQRIHELRELFGHLNQRYAWLANNFAMLDPVFTDQRLRKRLFDSNKWPGASLVATALFNACVLDVCTLLLDDEQNRINPSVRRVVKLFLPQNRKKNSILLDRIATLYSQNKRLRRQFRRAAETWADDLTADWGQLQKASKQFKALRDRWIAHNEVEWDSVNQTFLRPNLSAATDLYPTLRKTVRIIDQTMVHLMRLVLGSEMKQRKFKREIAESAAAFWNLKPPKKPSAKVTSNPRLRGAGDTRRQ